MEQKNLKASIKAAVLEIAEKSKNLKSVDKKKEPKSPPKSPFSALNEIHDKAINDIYKEKLRKIWTTSKKWDF